MIDFLIVGQGLAGSILAYTLMQHGKQVCVIDEERGINASRVAAGLINPITGQRLVKAVDVDDCLTQAREFYRHLEHRFGQQFFIEKNIQRFFSSSDEQVLWIKRSQDAEYMHYIESLYAPGTYNQCIRDPYGSGRLKNSGYVRTTLLLDALKQYFIDNHSFRQGSVAYSGVQAHNNQIIWHDITARTLIFCQGYAGMNNPWFSPSLLRPSKGEILTLAMQHELPDDIVMKKSWVIPLDHYTCRVGASYDREHLDEIPTVPVADQLQHSLNDLFVDPVFKVIDHTAGVRPTTYDKNPIIGFSSQCSSIGIFNGFGSKGALRIPLYAQLFTRFLLGADQLPADVDVQR